MAFRVTASQSRNGKRGLIARRNSGNDLQGKIVFLKNPELDRVRLKSSASPDRVSAGKTLKAVVGVVRVS